MRRDQGLQLALDASGDAASAAVISADGVLRSAESVSARAQRGEAVMPLIDAVLRRAGADPAALAGVVCGAGPGSFTGLRIAAAAAKGIAHSLDIPLRAVPSLMLAAAAARQADGVVLVVRDALRGESYSQLLEIRGGVPHQAGPLTLGPTAELEQLAAAAGAQMLRAGDAASDGIAVGVVHVLASILLQPPVDTTSWEPDYGRVAEAQARRDRQMAAQRSRPS